MISKKALIATLNSMNMDAVLCPSTYRTANWRAGAAIKALESFVKGTFNQHHHAVGKRVVREVENPRWFKQLFTELEWASGDICVGTILQALA